MREVGLAYPATTILDRLMRRLHARVRGQVLPPHIGRSAPGYQPRAVIIRPSCLGELGVAIGADGYFQRLGWTAGCPFNGHSDQVARAPEVTCSIKV